MINHYMIKVWCEETKKYIAGYYYIELPILPRTIGYLDQYDIDGLPTESEVKRVFIDLNFKQSFQP